MPTAQRRILRLRTDSCLIDSPFFEYFRPFLAVDHGCLAIDDSFGASHNKIAPRLYCASTSGAILKVKTVFLAPSWLPVGVPHDPQNGTVYGTNLLKGTLSMIKVS
jgi:hypothetical protein